MVTLTTQHCRAPMKVKVGRLRIPSYCGRLTDKCRYSAHESKRGQENVAAPGVYTRLLTTKGFQGHAQAGRSYFTEEEWEDKQQARRESIRQVAQQLLRPPAERGSPDPGQRRVSFIRDSHAPATQQASVPSQGQEGAAWVGLTQPGTGRRIITTDQEVVVCMEKEGYRFAKLFSQYSLALLWRQQEVLEVEDKEESDTKPPPKNGSRAHRNSEDQRSSGGRTAAAWTRRTRDESSSSESEDDSSETEDDSSSTDEGGDRHQRRSRRRHVTSKSSKKRGKNKRAAVQRQRIGEHDKSVGNPKLIHGMAVNSDELLASLTPKHLSRKDGEKLFEVGVDVLSLPGMYRVKMDDRVAEAERTVMATTGLIQAAIGRRTRDPIDTMWQSNQRPALARVKTPEDLEDLIQEIAEVQKSSFEQQSDQLYTFLSARNYSTEEIERYQERGGLTVITRATYWYYMALLSHIRARYYGAPKGTDWKKTHGYGIWDYYNNKLLTLRGTSSSKRHFLLRVYVYLREANGKEFNEPGMAKYLWNRLTALQSDSGEKGGGSGGGGTTDRCGHCRNKALHTLLKREHTKTNCPFKDLSQSLARKAATKGHALLTENPQLSIRDMIAQAKAAAEAP